MADLTPEQVDAALDTCADKLFGPHTEHAPTPLADAIVVGVRRASVLVVAMVFGDEESRAAAYRASAVLQRRSER